MKIFGITIHTTKWVVVNIEHFANYLVLKKRKIVKDVQSCIVHRTRSSFSLCFFFSGTM